MFGWWQRMRVLATGIVVWDNDDGTEDIEYLGWRDRWAIFGVHSYNWWWVRRFGVLDCGCTRNPLTRRMALYRADCRTHSPFGPVLDELGSGR